MRGLAACLLLFLPATTIAAESHPPLRRNPPPSTRPLADGPGYFVHPTKGDDAAAGTRAAPWKSLAHAVRRLKPGDTLRLEIELHQIRRGIGMGSGTATVDGDLACRGEIMFALVEKPDALRG